MEGLKAFERKEALLRARDGDLSTKLQNEESVWQQLMAEVQRLIKRQRIQTSHHKLFQRCRTRSSNRRRMARDGNTSAAKSAAMLTPIVMKISRAKISRTVLTTRSSARPVCGVVCSSISNSL
jgi:hypothetical protein